jgi:hypothetical protein
MMESRGIHTWVTRGYGLKSTHCLGMFKRASFGFLCGEISVKFAFYGGGMLEWFKNPVVATAVMGGLQIMSKQN